MNLILPKNLSLNGFEKVPKDTTFNTERLNAIRTWIKENLIRTKNIYKRTKSHSYSLKHLCEKTVNLNDHYVANGEFIAGMILEGFDFKIINSDINTWFNCGIRRDKRKKLITSS